MDKEKAHFKHPVPVILITIKYKLEEFLSRGEIKIVQHLIVVLAWTCKGCYLLLVNSSIFRHFKFCQFGSKDQTLLKRRKASPIFRQPGLLSPTQKNNFSTLCLASLQKMLKSKPLSFLKKYIFTFQEANPHLLRIYFSGCLFNGFSKDTEILLGNVFRNI